MNHDKTKSSRFLTVDSLRGLAALSVVFYHLHTVSFKNVQGEALHLLSRIFELGYLGVPVFFVISGFVISASVRTSVVDFHYVSRFILRRCCRLDPPYWLSIFLDLSLMGLTMRVFHFSQDTPSAGKIIAHLFYMQDLLGFGNIAEMYWTLCLEVQFYIFFTVVFALSNKIDCDTSRNNFSTFIFLISTVISICISSGVLKNPLNGLFLSHWYLFILGFLCHRSSVTKDIPDNLVMVYFFTVFLLFLFQRVYAPGVSFNTIAALLTAIFIFFAAKKEKLTSWLTNRFLQYLGGISYSLYLFHAIIGDRFIAFFKRWLFPRFHVDETPLTAIVLLLAAVFIATAFADLACRLVEIPFIRLSKTIKIKNSLSTPPRTIRPK